MSSRLQAEMKPDIVTAPKSLIINSPYEAPSRHWEQARDGTLMLVEQRRPAGYEIFDIRNDTRRTEPLDKVNEIRGRVATRAMRTWYSTKPCHPTRKSALDEWVKAVNAKGGFGRCCCDVAFQPAQIQDILHKHDATTEHVRSPA